MANLHIKQWPGAIAAGKARILDAALDAGVPFPHGCGTGECGSCKCQLLSGEVTLDAYSSDALSPAERAAGLILACRARAITDVELAWLSSATTALPTIKWTAKVTQLTPAAHDVMIVRLSPPPGGRFHFHPGQFAKLRFGKLAERSYSMASQPGDSALEFHIRLVPNGQVSQHVANQLHTGDLLEVSGPFGSAHWQPNEALTPQNPLLLVAGGTGMAPILSVLDAALAAGVAAKQIYLYHGVRATRDLYANEAIMQRLQAHSFRFTPVLSHESLASARQSLVHEIVAKDFDSLHNSRIYTAGPPPMVAAMVALASQRGAAPNHIYADAFHAATPTKKGLWQRLTGRA